MVEGKLQSSEAGTPEAAKAQSVSESSFQGPTHLCCNIHDTQMSRLGKYDPFLLPGPWWMGEHQYCSRKCHYGCQFKCFCFDPSQTF